MILELVLEGDIEVASDACEERGWSLPIVPGRGSRQNLGYCPWRSRAHRYEISWAGWYATSWSWSGEPFHRRHHRRAQHPRRSMSIS